MPSVEDNLASAANIADMPQAKQSNPKDAVGSKKARWFSYVPLRVMAWVGLALLEGARKYGRHNYREAGVRASVYVDACVNGHLQKWWEGEDIDPDTCELDAAGKPVLSTGLNHIDKAIASLIVLRDGMLQGNWVDDRPPSIAHPEEFWPDLDKRAAAIIARYPDAKEPFTEERRKRERSVKNLTEQLTALAKQGLAPGEKRNAFGEVECAHGQPMPSGCNPCQRKIGEFDKDGVRVMEQHKPGAMPATLDAGERVAFGIGREHG